MLHWSWDQFGAGFCWALCLWLAEERLGYWTKRAKFCEKKVGFEGLMTAAVDIFSWGWGNTMFCVCFCWSLAALCLVRWRWYRENSSGRISFNARGLGFFSPLTQNCCDFFVSNFFQLLTVSCFGPDYLLELGQLPPKCSSAGGNLLYCSLPAMDVLEETLQIHNSDNTFPICSFFNCLSLFYFTFLNHLVVCVVRTFKLCSCLPCLTTF